MPIETLSPEEAKKLGFKPPQKSPSDGATAQTTKIVGFFNPNQWPVHIVDNLIGINLTLMGHKQFILDRGGKKINDPRLERFCGPNMLAKEVGDADLPINAVAKPSTELKNTPYGFGGSNQVTRTADGEAAVPVTKLPTSYPAASSSPVSGMSIENARKLGLISPTKHVDIDAGIPETKEGATDASNAPYIPIAHDVKVKPKREVIPDIAPETPEGAKIIEGLKKAATLNPDDPNIIRKTVEVITHPSGPGTSVTHPVGPIENVTITSTGQPGVSYVSGTDLPHPEPRLGEVEPEPEPDPTPVKKAKKFVCSVDGKAFAFRCQLYNYAKKKFDEATLNKIMAPYPVVGTGRPTKK